MDVPLKPGQSVRVLFDMWGNAHAEPGRLAVVIGQMTSGQDAGRWHVRFLDDGLDPIESIVPRDWLQVAGTIH